MQGRLCRRQESKPVKQSVEGGKDGETTAGAQYLCGRGASGRHYESTPIGIDAQLRRKRLNLAVRSALFIG